MAGQYPLQKIIQIALPDHSTHICQLSFLVSGQVYYCTSAAVFAESRKRLHAQRCKLVDSCRKRTGRAKMIVDPLQRGLEPDEYDDKTGVKSGSASGRKMEVLQPKIRADRSPRAETRRLKAIGMLRRCTAASEDYNRACTAQPTPISNSSPEKCFGPRCPRCMKENGRNSPRLQRVPSFWYTPEAPKKKKKKKLNCSGPRPQCV